MAEVAQDPPRKYFADQFDDEEVLFLFRKHPIVMRKGLILGLICLPLGVLPATFHTAFGMSGFFIGLGIGAVVGLILFAPSWIGWHFSVFIVTNQRFIQIKQKGLFNRSVTDISLQQIQSISYEVAWIQETLLGFGTIVMRTYVGELVIHDVHHPAKIQKQIVGILRDLGQNTNSYPGSAAGQIEDEEIEEA